MQPIYLVADTETIGLAPPPKPASGVVQIAWAEIDPVTLEIHDQEQYMINPGAPIAPGASAVHGWYDKDVVNAPLLQERFNPADPIVFMGHNTAFDLKFVGHAIANLHGTLCTLQLARHYIKDSKNHKLGTLAEHLDLLTGKAHDAAGDVETTVALLRWLVEYSGRTLPQLVAANKPKNFHTMPFGMHKGKLLLDLPIPYIRWFLEREIDQDLRYSLEQQLKVRA